MRSKHTRQIPALHANPPGCVSQQPVRRTPLADILTERIISEVKAGGMDLTRQSAAIRRRMARANSLQMPEHQRARFIDDFTCAAAQAIGIANNAVHPYPELHLSSEFLMLALRACSFPLASSRPLDYLRFWLHSPEPVFFLAIRGQVILGRERMGLKLHAVNKKSIRATFDNAWELLLDPTPARLEQFLSASKLSLSPKQKHGFLRYLGNPLNEPGDEFNYISSELKSLRNIALAMYDNRFILATAFGTFLPGGYGTLITLPYVSEPGNQASQISRPAAHRRCNELGIDGWAERSRFFVLLHGLDPIQHMNHPGAGMCRPYIYSVAQHELQHILDFGLGITLENREYTAYLAELVFGRSIGISVARIVGDRSLPAPHGPALQLVADGLAEELGIRRVIGLRHIPIMNLRAAARRILNLAYKNAVGLTYDELLEPLTV